jgi:hypothetical protein
MNIKEFKSELKSVYNEFSNSINNTLLDKKYIRDAKQYLAILEDGGLLNPSELTTLVTSLCQVNNLTSCYGSIKKLLDSHQFSLLSKILAYECVIPEDFDNEDYQTNHFQSLPKNRKVNKQVVSFVLYLVYRQGWLKCNGISNIRPIMRQIVAGLVDKQSKDTILKLVG